jgi:hypothetical protein
MAKKKSNRQLTQKGKAALAPPKRLVSDLRRLIEQSREQVAATVNTVLVMTYWHIGKRIGQDVLKNERAAYGEEIVSALSAQLAEEFGRGFSAKALWRMVQFAESLPNSEIVAALSRQLSWSHFVELLPIDDPLKRDFFHEAIRLAREQLKGKSEDSDSNSGSKSTSGPHRRKIEN